MNRRENQVSSFTPNLDYQEERRRSKLHAVLHAVRRVLDSEGIEASNELQRLVALCVAEIATIERVSDPLNAMEFVALVEGWLRVDPWDALALWKTHAVGPIQAEAARWHAHVEQAKRKAEPKKFHHKKLVDPAAMSAILGLTRKRIQEVFGKPTCSLPPVRKTDSRFTAVERAEIRELAERSGYTKRWIKELVLRDGGEVEFCNRFLAFELSLLPAHVLDRNRSGIAHVTDLATTKYLKKFKLHRKPGPKSRSDSIELQVARLAKDKRQSDRQIYRKIAAEKAVRASENVELDVRMSVNCCQDVSEFPRSATSTFSDVFDTDSGGSPVHPDEFRDTLDGGGYTDTELAIAELAMTLPRASKKRRIYNPDNIELLARWYQAERGKTLTPQTYWAWNSRGSFDGHLNTARRWDSKQEFLARELAADAAVAHVTTHRTEIETDGSATRPVRGPEVHPSASSLAASEATGDSDGP